MSIRLTKKAQLERHTDYGCPFRARTYTTGRSTVAAVGLADQ